MKGHLTERAVMAREIRRNSLVRIGNGKKVYRVFAIVKYGDGEDLHELWADAEHPDAAIRVPDACRWYKAEELRPVEAAS